MVPPAGSLERGTVAAVRSTAATVVGWLVVLLIASLVFGSILGTIRWLLRLAGIIVLILVLVWVYFRLRGDP